jgi:N-acetylglutamate synthase-like GNAT family acetyltransferase
MRIRLARAAELPILEALARAIWPSTYATIISAAQIEFMLDWMYSTKTLLQQQEEGHEFYIIESAGIDSGFMALEWVKVKKSIKINKLYVLPSLHGQGAGRLLIDKAIERAKATNASQLYLQVNKANKAKDFYLRMGFQIDQEAVFDIGNGFVMDDYIMTRAL